MEFEVKRFNDGRSDQEKTTHTVLFGGIDSFMSSFGPPSDAGVKSRAYWACKPEDSDKVREWVRSRGDIKRVFQETGLLVASHWRRDYVHIYSVNEGHNALIGSMTAGNK